MLKREFIRLKTSHIIMIVVMFLVTGLFTGVFTINKYMDSQITFQKSLRDGAKNDYDKTTYIENNIKTFYDFINKSRTFSTVSMYDLKKEFSFLIPSNVKINNLELRDNDGGTVSGQATDFRTVDFISNTFKTYSGLYGTISDVTVSSSSKTSPTNVSFKIIFKIDSEKLKNKIYTEDIDGDGIKDFKEESVNVGGVNQVKKVINDECPFTPKYFVIGKMLEQNPTLLDVYPKYKQMYEEGYLTLASNGCMKSGDYNILN